MEEESGQILGGGCLIGRLFNLTGWDCQDGTMGVMHVNGRYGFHWPCITLCSSVLKQGFRGVEGTSEEVEVTQ